MMGPDSAWSLSGLGGGGNKVRKLEWIASAAVDPLWLDQYDGSALLGHDPVILFPVVVAAAGGDEHFAQQQPQPLGVDSRIRVVRPDQLRAALDGGPGPARADDDRQL